MFYHFKVCNRYLLSQHLFACSYEKCGLVKNSARMIQKGSQNSTLKAIYTCSTIPSYEIGIFSCNIFLHVRMQHCELMKNYA